MFEKVGKGQMFLEVKKGFINHCQNQVSVTSINLKPLPTSSNLFQHFSTFFLSPYQHTRWILQLGSFFNKRDRHPQEG